MAVVNPMYPTYATLRHQELIAESRQRGLRAALRRHGRANRAADLVARTHS
jgi:hypothetical protein